MALKSQTLRTCPRCVPRQGVEDQGFKGASDGSSVHSQVGQGLRETIQGRGGNDVYSLSRSKLEIHRRESKVYIHPKSED